LALHAEWFENESVDIITGLETDVFRVSSVICAAMKEDRFGKTALFQLCQRFSILIAFVASIAWYLKFLIYFPLRPCFATPGAGLMAPTSPMLYQNYGAN